jgi:hypothetical protein
LVFPQWLKTINSISKLKKKRFEPQTTQPSPNLYTSMAGACLFEELKKEFDKDSANQENS